MFVELCVILRMYINDLQVATLDSYEIIPCHGSRETLINNALKEIKENLATVPNAGASANAFQETTQSPNLKALWTHNPIARQSDGSDWSRLVPFRQPHSLTKLSKTFQKDFSPYFKKSDFEFERRNKPITLVTIRKNGITQRKAMYKSSPEARSGEVAELQSSFNDVGAFWQDPLFA